MFLLNNVDINFFRRHIKKLQDSFGLDVWPTTKANELWPKVKALPESSFSRIFVKLLNNKNIDPECKSLNSYISDELNKEKEKEPVLSQRCSICNGKGIVTARTKDIFKALTVWRCACANGAASEYKYSIWNQALSSKYDIED